MSFFTQKEIDEIVAIALEAGEIAKKYFFSKEFKVQKKTDNSSVTDADLAISIFISQKLKEVFSAIPVVCEEGKLREFSDEIFWLIDPIDGTSSFIEGSEQFAICIALVKNHQPVFGLINAPVFEGGKLVYLDVQNRVILLEDNRKTVLKQEKNDKKMLRIITSPRTKEIDIDRFIKQHYDDCGKEIIVERLSSAAKFINLLESKADIYLHLRKSMEWDIVAGHALLKNMNGKVKNLSLNEGKFSIGDEMIYKKPGFSNQFFIANF